MLIHETSKREEIEEFFAKIPTTLCKYRYWSDKYHKRIITESELFFSSPKHFNDPYDCGLPFRQHPENSDPLIIKSKVEANALGKYPELKNNPIIILGVANLIGIMEGFERDKKEYIDEKHRQLKKSGQE